MRTALSLSTFSSPTSSPAPLLLSLSYSRLSPRGTRSRARALCFSAFQRYLALYVAAHRRREKNSKNENIRPQSDCVRKQRKIPRHYHIYRVLIYILRCTPKRISIPYSGVITLLLLRIIIKKIVIYFFNSFVRTRAYLAMLKLLMYDQELMAQKWDSVKRARYLRRKKKKKPVKLESPNAHATDVYFRIIWRGR